MGFVFMLVIVLLMLFLIARAWLGAERRRQRGMTPGERRIYLEVRKARIDTKYARRAEERRRRNL